MTPVIPDAGRRDSFECDRIYPDLELQIIPQLHSEFYNTFPRNVIEAGHDDVFV
jgi:hypothetical protein